MTQTANDSPVSFEAFRTIVAEQLQVEKENVAPDASFVEDLHADSIQLVEMMLHMEDLGIEIPIESAWEIKTVEDAYDLYRQSAISD